MFFKFDSKSFKNYFAYIFIDMKLLRTRCPFYRNLLLSVLLTHIYIYIFFSLTLYILTFTETRLLLLKSKQTKKNVFIYFYLINFQFYSM